MKQEFKKDRVKEYLKELLHEEHLGRERAVSGHCLFPKIRITANELQKAVHSLRCEGVPIASCPDGYYYAKTAREVYSTIRGLKKMRAGLDAAIAGLESALDGFEKEPAR